MPLATNGRNILQLMRDRELNDHIRTKYAMRSTLDNKYITRLGLCSLLAGHEGCVNCLQWNNTGSILASASDDFQVILWDPFLKKAKNIIKTLHRGNIFTVKFIPNCHDDLLATGAGDWNTHTYSVTTGKQLTVCSCARGRVKRIAVANDIPSVYWSASEDGWIRQHDLRMGHECRPDQHQIGLVKVYNNFGTPIEAKCLDINQLRTEQLAVGANDPYVRLYDRRMISSLSSIAVQRPFPKYPSDYVFKFYDDKTRQKKTYNTPDHIAQYFVPGHINLEEHKLSKKKNIGITYLTFSPDGRELLANYGGDYVYLYNLSKYEENVFYNIPKVMKVPRENGEGTSKDILYDSGPVTHLSLPSEVEKLKLKANEYFADGEYSMAINFYNVAIEMCESSVLYSNRAAAYIKREWRGDYYAALKDCVTALQLEPYHMKAHFRLIICLCELEKLNDSKMYLQQFTNKFPTYKSSPAYKNLLSVISLAECKIDNTLIHDDIAFHEILKTKTDDSRFGITQKITLEGYFRSKAKDYQQRYYGHCNTSTDIKEANFFGSQNQFIVAGSDDGLVFIWEKRSENNLLSLKGDSSIVNCVQPHPSEFMLATSGIDNEIKLWTPLTEGVENKHETKDLDTTAFQNQRRMIADPFELIMHNLRGPVDERIEIPGRLNPIGSAPLSEQFYACRQS